MILGVIACIVASIIACICTVVLAVGTFGHKGAHIIGTIGCVFCLGQGFFKAGQHALTHNIGGLHVFDHAGAVGEIFAVIHQPIKLRKNRVQPP